MRTASFAGGLFVIPGAFTEENSTALAAGSKEAGCNATD